MNKMQKIASLYGLTDKEVSDHDTKMKSIPLSMFGDPLTKSYPLHTKEACVSSMAEFIYDQNTDAVVKDRISKAASFYELTWPELREEEKISFSVKNDDVFLNLSFSPNSEGIEKAASELFSARKHNDLAPCKELAQNLLKVAYSRGCHPAESTEDKLMKLAGWCVGDKESVIKAIQKRAGIKADSSLSNQMEKYLEHINNTMPDMIDCDDLNKIASVLDSYDALNNNRESYGTYLNPPEEEIFTKTAKDLVSFLEDGLVVKSCDAVVSKKDLHKHASEIKSLLADMGIYADEQNIEKHVENLTQKQAAYLFDNI